MTIAVTGATSMLGVSLIQQCAARGVKVLAIARRNSPNLSRVPRGAFITLLEAGLEELAQINPDVPCDVFYHFAWDGTSKEARGNPLTHAQNIRFTLDAVILARRLGCKAFIGAGSQAEYGICHGTIAPETRVDPVSAYGVAKFAAGKLSRALCEEYGMRHIWARVFSVYGEHDGKETMIRYALECFRDGRPARFSSASQLWNYLYEADAGKILYLLGERNVPGGVYCVASQDTRPLRAFVLELAEICEENGLHARFEFAPPDNRPSVSLDPDVSSLIAATGYRPETTFRAGVSRMLRSLLKTASPEKRGGGRIESQPAEVAA